MFIPQGDNHDKKSDDNKPEEKSWLDQKDDPTNHSPLSLSWRTSFFLAGLIAMCFIVKSCLDFRTENKTLETIGNIGFWKFRWIS